MSLKETNKIETNRYQLEIVIDGEKFREAIKDAYRKNGKKINVPGFRKGKAPLHIIETYYGTEVFYEDALNLLYSDVVEEAINESGLKVIDDKMDFDLVSISKEDGVDFKVSVTTYPEIELTEYKGLKAERPLLRLMLLRLMPKLRLWQSAMPVWYLLKTELQRRATQLLLTLRALLTVLHLTAARQKVILLNLVQVSLFPL